MEKEKKPDIVVWDEEKGYYAKNLPYASDLGAPAIKVDDVKGWRQRQFLQWAVDRLGDALTELGQQRGGMALLAPISSHTSPETFHTLLAVRQCTDNRTLFPYAWKGQPKPTTLRTRFCCCNGCEQWAHGLTLVLLMTFAHCIQNTQTQRMQTPQLETRSSLGDELEFRSTAAFPVLSLRITSLYSLELPTSCRSCNA